jgi:molybdopterin-guanine dinucleotide biosynthesis protein A
MYTTNTQGTGEFQGRGSSNDIIIVVASAGYVLAGGRSSRMGRDKALLLKQGLPLASWVATAAAETTGSATLVGDPARYTELGFRVIPDRFPGEGPLGGILTALQDSSAGWNLVLACDMPRVNAALLQKLLGAAFGFEGDAVIPVTGSSNPLWHPLCGVYRQSAVGLLEAAFMTGVRSVNIAVRQLRVLQLEMGEAPEFQNVNTPEDWAAYAAG